MSTVRKGVKKMFERFHCLHRSVLWDCDYTFEDFGYEGEGIVQTLHCENCGAEIEYRIAFKNEKASDDEAETQLPGQIDFFGEGDAQ